MSRMCKFYSSRWVAVIFIALAISQVPGAARAGDAEPVTLVKTGVAQAVVVLPPADVATQTEREAAALLVRLIERMSGARLPIQHKDEFDDISVSGGMVTVDMPEDIAFGFEDVPGESSLIEDQGSYILIGHTGLTERLGVDADRLGPGGVRLKTVGNAVVLLGGPESRAGEVGSDGGGVRYAVIELLEQLGVHYLWPGELGLVVPDRRTLQVRPLDMTYTPVIRRRSMRWRHPQWGVSGRVETGWERLGISSEKGANTYTQAVAIEGLDWIPLMQSRGCWNNWMRLGGQLPSFGHGGSGLHTGRPVSAEDLDIDPEWFALQGDGTRDQAGSTRWRLCKSNPDLIAHVAESIIERRNENPDLELVSLDPNDGGGTTGWCLCENCQALDPEDAPRIQLMTFQGQERRRVRIEHPSLTDRHVYYWNQIAERVTQEHPDLLFGISAYSAFGHPPVQRELHPNLVVRYVPSEIDRWEGWEAAGARRIYWRPNILLVNRRDGKLQSMVHRMADSMNYFAESGMMQTDFDSIYNHWSTFGLTYYATARLNWDPSLTAEQIISDYARHGFGPATAPIAAYFHRIEELTKEGVHGRFEDADHYRYTPEVAAELRGLLDTAESAAQGNEQIIARIAFLRLGLNFTELHELLDDKARRAADGEPVDMARAEQLVDLNCLVLRDIAQNHHLTINVGGLVWGSGTFAKWRSIGGGRVDPSDPALLERLDDPRYGLTGHENGIADMLAAYGMAEVESRAIPFHETRWLEPEDFDAFSTVLITSLRDATELRPWRAETVEHIRAWVEKGGTLILAGTSPYNRAGNQRDISVLEPLLGGRRYSDAHEKGRVLVTNHPLTRQLRTHDWFDYHRGLSGLTTATALVGAGEERPARISINEIGEGRVIYIAPVLGRISDANDQKALGALFEKALNGEARPTVELADFADAATDTPPIAIVSDGSPGTSTKNWLIANILHRARTN